MKTIVRVTVGVLLVIVAGLNAQGCHTIQGVGKDIQHSGEELESLAN